LTSNRKLAIVASTFTAAVAAAFGVTVAVNPHLALAHGTMQSPASRTYACYQNGLTSTNEIKPTNPACIAAVAAGGTQPLYDWYGVLNSTGAGRTVGYIPDGKLCSGDNPKYAAYDVPSLDWPTSTVTPGAQFDFVYGAWVPHPGGFRLYVTKDGWDPTQPLTWAEMEDQPFLTADPEPAVSDGAYRFSGRLPANKTGRHIIYSVWFRSDSQETFYGCSDVIFSGTGSPGPSAPPSSAPPSSLPPTDMPPSGTCTATVTTVSSWSGGFQAEVKITNTGTVPINNWYIAFMLPAGDTLGSGWSGQWMASGPSVMVHAPTWATQLAAGASASAGFLGTGPVAPSYSSVNCG
jgi:chitin-binding protein